MVKRFQDKIVLVTGSSRGIGRATALLFAAEGANVIVNYLRAKQEAQEVVKEIEGLGGKCIAIKCDVSDEKQVKKMIEKTIDKFGHIDILVNNAGIVFDVPFFDQTVEQWQATLNTNLVGTFLCSQLVAKQMLERGQGNIVNISSTNGIDAFNPDAMGYDASKAGIIIATRDLALALGPKIRVNSVAPGWVDTDMNADLPDDFVENEMKKIYLKRFAQPEEIAKAVLFLASDEASYITGSTLKVDGGYG